MPLHLQRLLNDGTKAKQTVEREDELLFCQLIEAVEKDDVVQLDKILTENSIELAFTFLYNAKKSSNVERRRTILMVAIENGSFQALNVLVEQIGSVFNYDEEIDKFSEKELLLNYAEPTNHLSVLDMAVDYRTQSKRKPHITNVIQSIGLLIRAGCRVNHLPILHHPIRTANLPLVKYLVEEHHADFTHPNEDHAINYQCPDEKLCDTYLGFMLEDLSRIKKNYSEQLNEAIQIIDYLVSKGLDLNEEHGQFFKKICCSNSKELMFQVKPFLSKLSFEECDGDLFRLSQLNCIPSSTLYLVYHYPIPIAQTHHRQYLLTVLLHGSDEDLEIALQRYKVNPNLELLNSVPLSLCSRLNQAIMLIKHGALLPVVEQESGLNQVIQNYLEHPLTVEQRCLYTVYIAFALDRLEQADLNQVVPQDVIKYYQIRNGLQRTFNQMLEETGENSVKFALYEGLIRVITSCDLLKAFNQLNSYCQQERHCPLVPQSHANETLAFAVKKGAKKITHVLLQQGAQVIPRDLQQRDFKLACRFFSVNHFSQIGNNSFSCTFNTRKADVSFKALDVFNKIGLLYLSIEDLMKWISISKAYFWDVGEVRAKWTKQFSSPQGLPSPAAGPTEEVALQTMAMGGTI